jgi:aspartokinase
MTERIQCGGLMERGDLCLVEVISFDWRPGQTCGILGKFGQAEIALSYLSMGRDHEGSKNMSFCVSTDTLASHRHILQEIEDEFDAKQVSASAPVTILTLYGPHFLEKHNLAAEVFNALCVEGIDALTVCSSINSISVVINIPDRDRTVNSLRQRFSWPE